MNFKEVGKEKTHEEEGEGNAQRNDEQLRIRLFEYLATLFEDTGTILIQPGGAFCFVR